MHQNGAISTLQHKPNKQGQRNPSCDAQSRPSQLGDASPQQAVQGTETEFLLGTA
jgi:hypothetical protein